MFLLSSVLIPVTRHLPLVTSFYGVQYRSMAFDAYHSGVRENDDPNHDIP